MKKVSIVLPTFNGEIYLANAINSVLQQSYKNFELILVDDCSTDGTSRIIQEFAQNDPRIRYIRNESNQKLPNSLNIGFAAAVGEYFTWTSDDNLYAPHAIEKMVTYLDEHDELGMVYCDYTVIDENGREVRENHLEGPERLLWTNTVGACFLYRREIAEEIGGYNSELFLAEDYDYWLRIYQAGEIGHLQENLYRYRQHGKSLTANRAKEIRHRTVLLWLSHWKFISSKLQKIRTKLHYCDMIMDMEAEEWRGEIYAALKKKVPLYAIYRIWKQRGNKE